MTTTTERLTDTLRTTPGVDAWQVASAHREEAQVYLIGANIEEARRSVSSDEMTASLHNLHTPHTADATGQALGSSSLTILPEEMEDQSRLAARLRDGALMASLTDNQPFTLPGAPAQGFPVVETDDVGMGASMEAAVERVGQQLRAALRLAPGVRLGSAEVYATRTQQTLTNSQGLSASARETTAFLDLALIAGEGDNVAEFHAELHRRRLSDLHVERIVAAYGAFALHALHATAPDAWQGPVVLSGEAAAQLFNPLFFESSPFVAHSSAEMAYRTLSRFTVGEFVTTEEPRGDRLTLVSDATRPYGSRTSAFDRNGTPARNVTLIEGGVFKRPWAEARYAQYLGVEPTGAIGNLSVSCGTTPVEQLRAGGPVYEVVAFSWFNPDVVSGDFSAEIRLGYRHDAAGVRPIKGGSVVGNLFTAFSDARFSAEPFTDGTYFGPAAIRFANLTITGG